MTELSENSLQKRTRWAWIAGTWFGVGLLKPGPGTWGSVAATALWLLAGYALRPYGLSWTVRSGTYVLPMIGFVTLLGAAVVLAIGIPAATIVGRESGSEDPQHVVIDEVCGQWIALLFVPFTWRSALISLLLFRIFDIVKPPPARQLERLHGGAGVMLDDVAAGAYALVGAHLLQHWFHLATLT